MSLISNTPWYILLLCLAAGVVFALIVYYKNKKAAECPRTVKAILFSLRALAVSLVALLLAGLLLKQTITESKPPRVIIAVDNSASMLAAADSSFVRGKLLDEINGLRDELSGKSDVNIIPFSAGADHQEISFTGRETDIDALLREVSNNFANDNISALLLISDGIYNRGANPVYTAENLGYPVHVVMTGDTAEKTDAFISKVSHNQVAYLSNQFPVEIMIGAKRFAGENAVVEISSGNSIKHRQEVKFSGESFARTLTFTLAAQTPGVQRFTARIITQKKEQNLNNNSMDFVIEVIDNKDKIMLVAAAPHPDIAAIKEVISRSGSYQLEMVMGGTTPSVNGFNLVIIHGSPSIQEQLIKSCTEAAIPYWLVNPSKVNDLPGIRVTNSLNRFNDVETFPDPSFGYFLLSDELRRFIPELPALKMPFGNYELAAGSSPLLKQKLGAVETDNPILYFNDNSGLRNAVFLGEGLWRWKMRDYAAHQSTALFNELIGKTIQFLSVKSDKSFFRIKSPRVVAENENIEFEAELYNKSYEPVNSPEVFLTLRDEKGRNYKYTFSKTGRSYRLDAGRLPAGEYRYTGQTSLGGENFKKEGILMVKETFAEKINTVANHQLLRELAARTGGSAYSAQGISKIRELLTGNGSLKTVIYAQSLTRPLIDEAFIFFIIAALWTVEWFLRKRYLII